MLGSTYPCIDFAFIVTFGGISSGFFIFSLSFCFKSLPSPLLSINTVPRQESICWSTSLKWLSFIALITTLAACKINVKLQPKTSLGDDVWLENLHFKDSESCNILFYYLMILPITRACHLINAVHCLLVASFIISLWLCCTHIYH